MDGNWFRIADRTSPPVTTFSRPAGPPVGKMPLVGRAPLTTRRMTSNLIGAIYGE